MNNQPLVSVCMTAYNHAPFVKEAVESVLSQHLEDFEFLIADDGSTDGTYQLIQGYKDHRIRHWRMPQRSGPSAALNSTLHQARGRYVAIFSSDDRWLPEKLQSQFDYLETHPTAGGVFSQPGLIDSTGSRLSDNAHFLGLDPGVAMLTREQWLQRMFFEGNFLCAITPMLRTETVRSVGDFNPLMLQLQDFDYWVRFLSRQELGFQPERFAEYRVNPTSLSTASSETYARTAYEFYQVLRHFLDGFPADAVAGVPMRDVSLISWQPQSPSRALRLAEHALHTAVALPQRSFPHFLFALDCMQSHAQTGLVGAETETHLFPFPYFEVTGSSLAQNFFFGQERIDAIRHLSQAAAGDSLENAPAGNAKEGTTLGFLGRLLSRINRQRK